MDLSKKVNEDNHNSKISEEQLNIGICDAICLNDKDRMNIALFVSAGDDSRFFATKKLLEAGARPQQVQRPFRCSPLQRAQERGAIKTVELFLESCVDAFLTTNLS